MRFSGLALFLLLGSSTLFSQGRESPYPNPFGLEVTVAVTIPEPGASITLDVYNIRAEFVKSLLPGSHSGPVDFRPGAYTFSWDGTGHDGRTVVPGFYFIVLSSESVVLQTVKVIKM